MAAVVSNQFPTSQSLRREKVDDKDLVYPKSNLGTLSDESALSSSHIDALRHALHGTKARVVLPHEEGYDAAIRCWSRAAEKPASVAVIPTNTEEVSIVIKVATNTGAELAIKGGGHSSAGASCTDGGILIDLSAMRAVKVDPAEQLIFIQGGKCSSLIEAR